MHRVILRTLKYMMATGVTFGMELFLLWLFTDIFNIHYIFSAILAFIITVSAGYIINRWFVFRNSRRPHLQAYSYFVAISLGGLLIVVVGLAILVQKFHVYYLYARICVIVLTFLWTYTMNVYFNFKVGEKTDL
jgi:putative flippase GtrA